MTKKAKREGKRHIVTVSRRPLRETAGDCTQCQVSCQSACKTSCTVGNQLCAKE